MLSPQEVEAYFAQIGITAVATRGDWRDARCVWHEDRARSFTFNVKSGGWKCQAGCGQGGLKEAAERSGVPFPRNGAEPAEKKASAKTLERTYDYTDERGVLLFQVCRFKTAKSKTFLQRQPTPEGGWLWKMDDVRVVPYHLPELLAAPADTPAVFVVEGEKDADALWALGLPATTNHGGAGKWKAEHAQHLRGRRVIILPDNDKPGRAHAQAVAQSLVGTASEIRILELPDLPEKGDVSDWLARGGTKDALGALAAAAPAWQAAPPPKTQPAQPSAAIQAPFDPLGYADGAYYYLNRRTGQVSPLFAAQHSKLPLLALAPLAFWGKAYPGDTGPNWTAAASDLLQKCSARGVFDHTRIRGRGAWHENGKPVVHVGNVLIVDGQTRDLASSDAGFIYPAAVPIPIDYQHPMEAGEAARLSALCDMLSWERPIHGRLFAGWLALAPICGALAWRPHIWITGAAGTGKSWVMDKIMRPMLGRIGLFVQSDTTEAGIRQALGYDARPVLFDEAEGESERAQARMQNVLALMRQSSSENGSVIVKGSTSGAVKVYCIRSCFAFSSIGVGIKQHSDSTRVTVLGLVKPDPDLAAERFAEIQRETAELLTTDWVGSLHARMIALIPTIRANARTFACAAAHKIGSQRMGDQVGVLLAGAYALHHNDEITRDGATAWVGKQDWTEQTTIQETPDERLCLDRILQHVVPVRDGAGRIDELTVAELIESSDYSLDPATNPNRKALLRLGIRVDQESIIIANQHAGIQKIMAGTPWTDWGRLLRRIAGSAPTSRAVRFAGSKARGTIIPLDAISN